MSWFRVDDTLPDHPKLDSLESDPAEYVAAVAAWTLVGADCAKRRTDGVFTESRLRRRLPWPEEFITRARDALLRVGLWERIDASTIRFHDWQDYQPTKEEIDAGRKAATERQKRWRQKRLAERIATDNVDASTNASTNAPTNGVTDAVTNGVGRQSPVDASVDGTGASTRNASVDGAPSHPVPSRPSGREREATVDKAQIWDATELEQRGFKKYGALTGSNAAIARGFLPITLQEFADAYATEGKSWSYFVKVMRTIREAANAPKPPPAKRANGYSPGLPHSAFKDEVVNLNEA